MKPSPTLSPRNEHPAVEFISSTELKKTSASQGTAHHAFELRKILVPVDFSGRSESALPSATVFASRFGGKITLLHVLDRGRVSSEMREFGIGWGGVQRGVHQRLGMLASRFGEADIFDKVPVRSGRPFHEIGLAASELGCDLIVISTHGYTGLDYMLLGGTAERVICHAPCPVLVVRGQNWRVPEPKKILVPVDFSPTSLDGLRYALGLGRPFGANVTALHVIEPLGPMSSLKVDVHAHERKLREASKFRLEALHLEVNECARAFDTLYREGTSYHEIVGMAQRGGFDLIIMASLGRSGLADMLLGSTAQRVVRHAPCPVLVVRNPRPSRPQTA